jgi:peptidoglycan lytic transglycosylase
MDRAHARRPRADHEAEPARPRPKLRVVDSATPAPAWDEPPFPERRTIRITGRPDPYRRRSAIEARVSSRPDRVALWAVLLAVFMVVMAGATAKAESRYRFETLGNRVLKRGDAGSDVKTLQLLLIKRGYRSIGKASGRFGPKTERAVRRFQRRRHLEVDGKFGPASRRALTRGWRRHRATYYGPGLYGNKTACGQTLRHRTWGVAHRSLSCGSRVAFKYGGRIVIAPVIDRGPYTKGLSWDLTERVAGALHMRTTSAVRVAT